MAEHEMYDRNVRHGTQTIRDIQATADEMFRSGVDLFRKGMERTVQLQTQALDLTSQQNADVFELYRQVFRLVPGAEVMLRTAEDVADEIIETQKRALDLFDKQSSAFAESSRAQGERATRAAQRVTDWPTDLEEDEPGRAQTG